MSTEPVPRPTARVLVIDEEDKAFLIHTAGEIFGIGLPPVWLPPGGGLEAGETYEQAALRELQEEVAFTAIELGPCVWTRVFPYVLRGESKAKHERFFLCRVHHFELDDASDVDRHAVIDYRWWSLDEIDASSEILVPRALGRLLRPILSGDLPAHPSA